MPRELTFEEIEHKIKVFNLILLSKERINNRSKLNVECNVCHYSWYTFLPTLTKRVRKSVCPKCCGCKRLTYNDIKILVEKNNGQLISGANEYDNTSSRLHIKCNICSTEWKPIAISITRTKERSWCPGCSRNKRVAYEDVKAVVDRKGGELLTNQNEYVNGSSRIRIRCNKCKTEWRPDASHIVNKITGTWCPKCSGNVKYSYDDVRNNIEKRNGELLSKTYTDSHTKLKVVCLKCRNIWHTTFDSILCGKWCPRCAMERWRTNENGALDYIKSRGGQLLGMSESRLSCKTILTVKCAKGHVWHPEYQSFMFQKTWCHDCGLHKYNIEDVRKIVESKNGTLLTTTYTSALDLLDILCNVCKNIWRPSFSSINNCGCWCPSCSSGKNQRKISTIIKDIFPNKLVMDDFNNFDWLKTKNTGKQHIDIFVPDLKLAIEYDGEQHSRVVRFGGMPIDKAREEFDKIKYRDRLKDEKIKLHKDDIEFFIRIDYTEMKYMSKEYLKNRLKDIGFPIDN